MSFSVSFMGTPTKVVEALEAHSATLSGQSKDEYDDALPAIVTLVKGNVGQSVMVHVEATGHASMDRGVKTYGQLHVAVKPLYANFVG